ncbi:MAG: N-(5'-phosphoribosyl)anthranilate isomerase [Betaproteobacteria bacterium RIFCSPLOWO2_12_FULL_66_14]|nr:MAG: N-(5'-phosphoribosyl)anthranilate isomerase [Betaproteobacteria bacterium RIFCSPLOWO2_12_FULL_66_14]
MRTRVKICGITRPGDALDAIAQGVDALGFIQWNKSPRYIQPQRMAEIARELPAFVCAVAVFVNPTRDEVNAVLDAWPGATLQFHGEETPSFCAQFRRPWIKTARARPGLDLVEYLAPYREASAWLVDAFHEQLYGGTGSRFDWSLVPRSLSGLLILSGGLDSENVGEAIRSLHPHAVDVSTGVELDKGVKDASKIAAFMAEVRAADYDARGFAPLEEAG